MATKRECWIVMNDGVRLDASVFTPDGDAPEGGWPGVLFVHGHGDAGNKTTLYGRAKRYAERGFLTVSYSVRGQGDSEGLCFHMGPREVFDLQDVISWLLREWPVHPKKLGVVGSSQGGWHAYMAAAHHAQVATVVPENIFTDYAEFAVHNGCLAKWFFTRTMRRRMMTAGLQDMARQWALSGDWFLVREWVRPTSPLIFADRIHCPIFIVHGWHDVGMPPNEVVEMFNLIDAPKKLYLGGGGHDGLDSASAKEVREGLVDRWLDFWLKGEQNGVMDEPAVMYAQRPGWDHVSISSLAEGVETQTLYLSAKEPEQALPDDPHATFEVWRPQPVRSLITEAPDGPDVHSNIVNRVLDADYGLKEALSDDMDGVPKALVREVIGFASAPLDRALEILGAPIAKLCLMPNRPHMQVVVDLFDVSQGGERTLITRGQFGTRTAEPGQHVMVDIVLRTIGYLVESGHHLLLEVSNYDTVYAFPYFEPFVARVYHDQARASKVEIPVRLPS